jgi:PhnB protein
MMMMTHGERRMRRMYPDAQNAVLYAAMSIGETNLMGSEGTSEHFQPMRSVDRSLSVNTTDEAERIFALFSNGGEIFIAMQETFFAFRFAMLRDKFGPSWMIINRRPAPQSA